ncbi:hypothetical protein I4F81_012519 [Pyropia yezoensis]|uniref:Uncharacterized protein n=1 Tax=Pyropia yezoensis TaxID=2788 RepID=A0ACC3CJC8_PYRYE|nr:hypothetical protein I4F81_012519 [Neopyropia yezoensis]
MSSFDAPDMPSGQDAAAAAEVQQFLAEEQQRAAMLGVVSKLTVTCWDTCVSKPGSKLSSWESDCISNCARRFIDASVFILNRAAKQQGRHSLLGREGPGERPQLDPPGLWTGWVGPAAGTALPPAEAPHPLMPVVG